MLWLTVKAVEDLNDWIISTKSEHWSMSNTQYDHICNGTSSNSTEAEFIAHQWCCWGCFPSNLKCSICQSFQIFQCILCMSCCSRIVCLLHQNSLTVLNFWCVFFVLLKLQKLFLTEAMVLYFIFLCFQKCLLSLASSLTSWMMSETFWTKNKVVDGEKYWYSCYLCDIECITWSL